MKRTIFNILFLLPVLICTKTSGQKVTLDYYFNHEARKTAAGQVERYHYTWEDKTNSGFSLFGSALKKAGATLDTLGEAPTAANLKGAAIYIIVDPDTKKESPDPKYIQPENILEIASWVKAGGVLVMMANDSANVELPHFNNLASVFGMHFNDDLQNHVIDDAHFADGAVITSGNPLFRTAHKVFMKDVCSIATAGPARPALKNKAGATIIATAKYGKGTVFAVGDPWFYNEYMNGRLPKGYENDKAANDVAKWLIAQTHK
jgi:hypothetical protein